MHACRMADMLCAFMVIQGPMISGQRFNRSRSSCNSQSGSWRGCRLLLSQRKCTCLCQQMHHYYMSCTPDHLVYSSQQVFALHGSPLLHQNIQTAASSRLADAHLSGPNQGQRSSKSCLLCQICTLRYVPFVVLAGSASAYTSTSVAWCLTMPRWASPPQQPPYQTGATLRYAACPLTTGPLPTTRPTCCGRPWTLQSCSNRLTTSARLSCQTAGKLRCSSRHFSSAATVGRCCISSASTASHAAAAQPALLCIGDVMHCLSPQHVTSASCPPHNNSPGWAMAVPPVLYHTTFVGVMNICWSDVTQALLRSELSSIVVAL